jgi:succinate dehydrogenase / fumarate reductase, membrane anchor subunit
MVKSIMSLSRSGTTDFVIQRISAVIIALYALCVLGFLLVTEELSHAVLVSYFTGLPMQIFSTLAVLAVAAHAWIGMWTVGTDYIRPHYFGRHATAFRFCYELVCVLAIFVGVLWALQIFWRF